MVRFGNVLGSSGSVVPLFKKQIAEGGPITITHPDIIRYFMTISEAVELVLQAASISLGGDVFLLDMGEPMKISSLAEQMIKLSGLTIKNQENPNGDIEIIETGLRPGEKLFEELLINAESSSINGKIFNAGWENKSVNDIANTVKDIVGKDVKIIRVKTSDNRSYHISSEKIKKILKFEPKFTIEDAVIDLKEAFEKNKLPNSLTDSIYFNIKKMQEINLK